MKRRKKALRIAANDNRMRGIKIYYANSRNGYSDSDESFMFGQQAGGQQGSFIFQPGELIKSLSIWNTKWDGNTFVGAFKMVTSLGNVFYPKEKTSSHKEYVLNVGYGAVVGVAGRSGNALDKLGFYLIKDARALELSDVIYEKKELPEPNNVDLTNITYNNDTSEPQEYEYSYSYTEYDSYSWESNSGFEQSYSVSISAEVPELEVGAEATASWVYSYETMESTEKSTTKEVNSVYPVIVPPYTSVSLEMSYYSGHCKLSYTGLVEITLVGGNETFSYYTYGEYAGGNTTDIIVTVIETPIDAEGDAVGESLEKSMVV
ncbi:jacalin-like lectin [Flavobacterium sp. LM5]|uniref:jacalin-like lectin n=1 Tax=Flavobacterium sp. LM5 TaxID=1938610 RepID=UPI0011163273|nr:jacalin-like lectin [Flavobacterium sp. LM5]